MWFQRSTRPSNKPPIAGLLALVLFAGCPAKSAKVEENKAQQALKAPPELSLKGDRADLIYSYSKDGGKTFQTASKIDQIPKEARKSVVVTDLSLSPDKRQAAKYVYLADLSAPREDGSYPVAVASRYGLEAKAAEGAAAPGESQGVVVYSTAWCGVCKKAKRLLKSWSVPFTEKDIEASASAQRELAQKAQAQGINPGGVPVIDVGGILLQGLDERTLKAALKQKGLL